METVMKENMIWIKTGLICCLVIFMAAMLMAGKADSKTDISEMEIKMLTDGDMGTLQKSDERMIKKVFGLNAADYDGAVYYKQNGALDVGELLIIKLKSDDQSATVEKAIRDRVDTQIQSFTNYGTNQIHLLNSCEIKITGNYCFYVVAENAQQLKKVFMDNY